VEDDDIVQAVQKLRAEIALELGHELRTQLVEVFMRGVVDHLGADIGGHDDHAVTKVHRAALAVRESAVVENLQQHVKHVRMGFLDLVKEDDAVGTAPHSFREVAAFVVTHISGRSTYQPGNRVLFHKLAHVQPQYGSFAVEEIAGQGFGQFRLSYSRGAQENEGADGTVAVSQTAAGASDSVGQSGDAFLLPHHSLGEGVLEGEQLGHLALQQFGDRNVGPFGDHLGHQFLIHLLADQRFVTFRTALGGCQRLKLPFLVFDQAVTQLGGGFKVAVPLRQIGLAFERVDLCSQGTFLLKDLLLVFPFQPQGVAAFLIARDLRADLFQAGSRHGVRFLGQRELFDLELTQLALRLIQFHGQGIDLHAQLRASFIHQVYRLVRQEPV